MSGAGCIKVASCHPYHIVAIDWMMRKTIDNKRRGIRWTLMSLLEDRDFADDVALVSSTRDQLQQKKTQTSR